MHHANYAYSSYTNKDIFEKNRVTRFKRFIGMKSGASCNLAKALLGSQQAERSRNALRKQMLMHNIVTPNIKIFKNDTEYRNANRAKFVHESKIKAAIGIANTINAVKIAPNIRSSLNNVRHKLSYNAIKEIELTQSGYIPNNAINTLRELSEAINILKAEYVEQAKNRENMLNTIRNGLRESYHRKR